MSFVGNRRVDAPLDLTARVKFVNACMRTSAFVESPHRQSEILQFSSRVLALPSSLEGVLVEAGCFKGSSTAKFSLLASMVNRELLVFDSFEGIPANEEPHSLSIDGTPVGFAQGDYCGTLEEVKETVSRYGDIESCRFVKGWFSDTMPTLDDPVAAAYIDVDLVASTADCLKALFPRIVPGGFIMSQDGHLPLVVDLLRDPDFWISEVGCDQPSLQGIGVSKLVTIVKD